ncbi:hypothetical protein LJC22_01240 [Desulfosarcina sp. OttesenSCG-928-G10]|nr:hypothetical protein [Desulfosarcina sp. OttesenSCG-928-G10]MDL2320872.1 hypothetical protein [Desulfosarcina sp. OttesenSCG-928-B08]
MKKLMTLCSLVLFVCTTQAFAAAPTQEQLVRMTKAMGITQQLEKQKETLQQQVKQSAELHAQTIANSVPNLPEAAKKIIQEELDAFLKKASESYDIEAMTASYMRMLGEKLSAEDVAQAIAFLETTAGKNMTKASTEISGPWTEQIMADYRKKMNAHTEVFFTNLSTRLQAVTQPAKDK